jgi:ADP-ribose pyrophosphatase
MDDASLIETKISSESVFDGALLKVCRDQVELPDSSTAVREWIDHPGAAVVIALLDNGHLIFERQFRYPLHQVFLELPAGKINPKEHPLDTAKRELREETGYIAKSWRQLGMMHPCIGYSNERIDIFLAQGLSFVGHERDVGENLEIIEMSVSDAMLAINDHEITDAKSIVALLWADKIVNGTWALPD